MCLCVAVPYYHCEYGAIMGRSSRKKGKGKAKGNGEKPKSCPSCKMYVKDPAKGQVCPGGCERTFCNRCVDGSTPGIKSPAFNHCDAEDECLLPARCSSCWSGVTLDNLVRQNEERERRGEDRIPIPDAARNRLLRCSNLASTSLAIGKNVFGASECAGIEEKVFCLPCATREDLNGEPRMMGCNHCKRILCSSCRESNEFDEVQPCHAPDCNTCSCRLCARILQCSSCKRGYCLGTCFEGSTKSCGNFRGKGCGRGVCIKCDPEYNVEKGICDSCHIAPALPWSEMLQDRIETDKLEDIAAAVGRLALKDDADLFGPIPPRQECPICMLPLPLVVSNSIHMSCCGKMICCGCSYENQRVINETNAKYARLNNGRAKLIESCAFCRKPRPGSSKENLLQLKKRMELNGPTAFDIIGSKYIRGDGVPKDEKKGFVFRLRAAKLGNAWACFAVSDYYRDGRLVGKDKEMERLYLEKAAKGGCAHARHNIGLLERGGGNIELAVKNWLISAAAGYQDSLDSLKYEYMEGNVSKGEFSQSLRSFQAARNEERSVERDRWALEKAKREVGGSG